MGLNRVPRLAWVAALVLVALATSHAGARFAGVDGFSGKTGGQTCLACHVQAHPTQDTAKAILEGLPETWTVGATYALRIRISGGPDAMPAPQPQGGFEIATDAGHFAGFDTTLLRAPNPQEVTYLPAGTLQREWTVDWVAPDLRSRPVVAHFWLAVLAANGNHVIATNLTDQGETFDSVDSITALVVPDATAEKAWQELPLESPQVSLQTSGSDLRATGQLRDENATRLFWRIDDEAWVSRAVTPEWSLSLPGLAAGDHLLEVRTEGAGRSSNITATPFHIAGIELPGRPSSAPALMVLLPFLIIAALRRRHP